MAMHPTDLLDLLVDHLGSDTDAVDAELHDMTDNGGYGLVRWSRHATWVGGPEPVHGREHVVHRWATKRTDGEPVRTESGLLLWSGAYFDDERSAREDYRRRTDGPAFPPSH